MEAMVKRPTINGVRFQVLGGKAEATEGTLCVSAFFLIFASRKPTSQDEVTVSSDNGCIILLSSIKDYELYFLRFFIPLLVRWRIPRELSVFCCF